MRRTSLVLTLCGALVLGLPAGAQNASTDLAGRVGKLEQALSNRGLIDLLNEVERLKQENQALRGQLENLGYEIEQLKKSQTSVYTDLDRRLQTIEGGGAARTDQAGALPMLSPAPGDAVAGTPAPQSALQVETETAGMAPAADADAGLGAAPPAESSAASDTEPLAAPGPVDADGAPLPPVKTPSQAGVAPIEPTLAPAPLPGRAAAGVTNPGEVAPPLAQTPTLDDASSEAAYRDAFALLRAGEYDRAIAAFNDFQAKYPQSQYGDNAQYWLAEAHYAKRDYAAAVTEYEKMLANYPQSRKLSHAMLKIGYSYDSLGKHEEARAVLEDLRKRFPGSAAARLAEERLGQLKAAR
ncbi:MAG TPA: tol-pal system protein YbgF [Gammaproteobacteria bacterium]|nr:tol-pal system protein YbgF [Gammaproteobacteria bacterium]